MEKEIFTALLVFIISPMNLANSGRKHVFLLAGQSNMAGQGGVVNHTWDHFVPAPECNPNPKILKLNAKLRWEVAKEPLHAGIHDPITGIGPGMPFANSLLKRFPNYGIIGLVPCAISGTKISKWQKGGLFYNQLVRRAKAAMRNNVDENSTSNIVEALLWYQGEADTLNQTDADAYKGRLHRFITDLRADLNLPNLLVIQVALASGGIRYLEKVRQAQFQIELPNVKIVDAMGLPVQADGLHLTSCAQVHLGKMLSDAFVLTNNYFLW